MVTSLDKTYLWPAQEYVLITSTLQEQGYVVDALDVAKASIPIAVILFIMVLVQNHLLDKSLIKKYSKKDN